MGGKLGNSENKFPAMQMESSPVSSQKSQGYPTELLWIKEGMRQNRSHISLYPMPVQVYIYIMCAIRANLCNS